MLKDVKINSEYRNYFTIQYKNLQIFPDIHRLNQIADIIIHPKLIPNNIDHISGYIEVYTSMNNKEPVLKILFDERIIHGSLAFKKEETYFYISNKEFLKSCQPIRVFNRYNTSVSVYNIKVDQFNTLSKYIQVIKIYFILNFFFVVLFN